MGRHRQRHISGWGAMLLAPVAIPLLLLVTLVQRLCGMKTTADLTAIDVGRYLKDFIDDGGGEWDWDDFTSIPISDPVLDRIRQEAGIVQLPLTDQGEVKLRDLLERVRGM